MAKAPKKQAPITVDLEAKDLKEQPKELAEPFQEDEHVTTTVQAAATLMGARKPNRLLRWFWAVFFGLFTFALSIAAWNFVTSLLATYPVLGIVAAVLVGLLVFLALLLVIRELAALGRLRKVDRLQARVTSAMLDNDLPAARQATSDVVRPYRGRADAEWGVAQFQENQANILDADGLIGFAETSILSSLDLQALKQIEIAARQVATVTALMPLALVDVVSALTANVRMIRQIAEIYGGRSGTFGSWRLIRSVLAHLVATGAVAIGDDMIGSVAGGSVLSKLSRRFGEGVINGALTARVGVAAMEVCRPMPFNASQKPKVTTILAKSVTGLFG